MQPDQEGKQPVSARQALQPRESHKASTLGKKRAHRSHETSLSHARKDSIKLPRTSKDSSLASKEV